ncbi:MAG TPA: tail fiber domain-containing protein, partial [Parafilimonas sp.]
LLSNTTGNDNTADGFLTLYSNTGSNNTGLGCFADINGDFSNSTAIGNSALITASNQVRIGNSSVTSIGGYVTWSNISDGRVKKNIKQNVPGLAFINKLQPITYNLDLDAANKIVQPAALKDKNGKIIQPSADDIAAKQAKEKIVYTGFIAQDVDKAAKDLNYDFSGVDAAKNNKDLYGLRYAEFVVPLVKAVQELSAKNDSKDSIIASLQTQVNNLNNIVQTLAGKAGVSLSANNISISSASLEQNIPNPFSQSTSIRYNLPAKFNAAQIIITDYSGKILKQINISASGSGTAKIDADSLSAGTYNYSLMVDGKLIDTKKMVLTK